MKVNDKRANSKTKVFFEDLPIGQAYEDENGRLCIKTSDAIYEDNCICFINEKWEAYCESFDAKVTPLDATLEIEK